VSKLAVNVARTARARVASRVHALEAERAAAYGALRVALGVDDSVDLELTGSLPELGEFGLAELLASSKRRPELARLAAEADAAEAAYELGEVESAPQLGLGVQYDHEADLDIVLGVVQVTLPIFERGQGRRASARASGARVEIEREQLLRQLPIRVRAAYDVATKRAEALRALETQGVAPFEENVSLARRAYEAGEMTLTDLLALRTEILLSRVELLERRRDAALAVVELLVAAGMKP
jgi:cobalt-zinc-cadmium efflux system outer membrane protein